MRFRAASGLRRTASAEIIRPESQSIRFGCRRRECLRGRIPARHFRSSFFIRGPLMTHQTARANRTNRRNAFLIDTLEPRRLFAVAPTLDDGLLMVWGSPGSDHLSIARS